MELNSLTGPAWEKSKEKRNPGGKQGENQQQQNCKWTSKAL